MDTYKILAIVFIILLILFIVVLNSRNRIIKTYNKYMKIGNKANLTGKEVAALGKEVLGLENLQYALTKNKLGDAYSPKYNTLILSEEVCTTASLSSLTIVAHELGHAVQDKNNNGLFVITRLFGKLCRLTNKLVLPMFIIGLLLFILKYPNDYLGYTLMIISGVFLIIHILNQILTIPLEYDASKKGLQFLKDNNLVSSSEFRKAKKLLGIAAQTYIAHLFDGLLILNTKRKKKKWFFLVVTIYFITHWDLY